MPLSFLPGRDREQQLRVQRSLLLEKKNEAPKSPFRHVARSLAWPLRNPGEAVFWSLFGSYALGPLGTSFGALVGLVAGACSAFFSATVLSDGKTGDAEKRQKKKTVRFLVGAGLHLSGFLALALTVFVNGSSIGTHNRAARDQATREAYSEARAQFDSGKREITVHRDATIKDQPLFSWPVKDRQERLTVEVLASVATPLDGKGACFKKESEAKRLLQGGDGPVCALSITTRDDTPRAEAQRHEDILGLGLDLKLKKPLPGFLSTADGQSVFVPTTETRALVP